MNREILFKAKRKDNGEWIQGYYYQIWQQGYILWGMINNMPDMVEVKSRHTLPVHRTYRRERSEDLGE